MGLLGAAICAGGVGPAGAQVIRGPLAVDAIAARPLGPLTVRFGRRIRIACSVAGAGDPRTAVQLQFAPAGTTAWRVLAHARADRRGRCRLTVTPTVSGIVRAVWGVPPLTGAISAPLPVLVRAALRIRHARVAVVAGQRALVDGDVAPSRAGREVALEVLGHGRWRAVAIAHTGPRGRFRLLARPNASRRGAPVRVVVAPGFGDGATAARVGRMESLRLQPAGASWYGPGGTTACGQTLGAGTLGVAHRTLPCGTLVLLRYGGRSIEVPVIDRGPYVSGRDFDLTYATKQALGFGDTGTVWWARMG